MTSCRLESSTIVDSIVLATVFCLAGFIGPTRVLQGAPPTTGRIVESGSLRFEEHLIMDKYTYAYGIAAADLDGDGDRDITSADALPNNSLYWFENDGQGGFRKHFIQRDDPERLERHQVADIDRDGRLDVVIVKNLRGDLLWFRNSGTPRDGKLWKRNVITKSKLPGAYDVASVDLDGDGDLDVAASSWRLGNEFAWFENDGTPAEGEWVKHSIEANIAETRAILADDVDGDKDPDLVGTARVAGVVVWYENRGDAAKRVFQKHVVDDKSPCPVHGHLVDMNGDGRLDILMAFGMGYTKEPAQEHVAWYENSGRPGEGPWQKHTIGVLYGAFEAIAVDLDGDKDLDVVATAWAGPGQVVWFENTGDPKSGWKMHIIKDKWVHANQVIWADFDRDGKPDLAACAERGSLELRWWRNLGRKNP